MLEGKSLLDYTNLFYPNEYKKNDKVVLKYFQLNLSKLKWLKSIVMFAINIENWKTLKYQIFLKNNYVSLLFAVRVVMNIEKYLKKKNYLKYYKFLV